MTDLYGKIPISGDTKDKDSPSPGKSKRNGPATPKPRDSKEPPKGKGKYLIFPAAIVALLICYYGFTTLLIPLFLERKFPALFQEKTGLGLVLGSVNFNPLNNALIIRDVNISNHSLNSDKTDLLTIDSVYIDLDITALVQRGFASESLQVKGAELTITKYDDTTYNISRFLPQDSNAPFAKINLSNVPFLYSLNNILISESRIIFSDLSTQKTHRIDNIQLSLPTLANFSFDVDKYIQPGFSAVINGSPVRLISDTQDSSTGPSDEPAKLSLSLQSINLPLYASYIPVQLPVVIKRGTADIQVEIAFKARNNEQPRLNLDYKAQIENGLFESHDQVIVLATPALQVEGAILPKGREIQLRSALFRDPTVTVKDSIAVSTIDSLFLQSAESEKTGDEFFRSAALTVPQLIADNARIIIESKDNEQVFYPVQLSIKNFANAKALLEYPANKEHGSFRLSGESETNSSTFNWQGTFQKTTPVGDVEINDLPADNFLQLLSDHIAIGAKGSAELRGRLSIRRSEKTPLTATIDQGSVQLSSFSLEEKGHPILQSSTIKISPFQLKEGVAHLGNIFLENASWEIDKELPKSLLNVLRQKSDLSFQGIDYKGKIVLHNEKGKNAVEMKDVHLQINDLEKKKTQEDNFIFSAAVGKNGSVKAKGKISKAPLDGSVKIAVAEIPATIAQGFTDASSYSISPTTKVNATGDLNLLSGSFTGTAEISQGEFRNSSKAITYAFGKAVLGQISFEKNKKNATVKAQNVLFKDLQIKSNDFSLHTEGASVSSLSQKGNDIKIDSLEFAKTAINIQSDFSRALLSLQQNNETQLNIAKLHLFGNITIADSNQGKTDLIKQFDLTLTPYDKDKPENDNFNLNADFVDEGILSARGTLNFHPLQAQVDLDLNKVNSHILNHFSTALTKIELNATMSGNVAYSYPEKIYSGDIQFDQGLLTNKTNEAIFKWEEVHLQNFKLSDSPFSLEADKLLLVMPQTTFAGESKPLFSTLNGNVNEYLQAINEKETIPEAASVMVRSVDINSGIIDFRIPGASPDNHITLSAVNGHIDNYSLQENNTQIEYSLQGGMSDGNFSLDGIYSSSLDSSKDISSLKISSFPLALLDAQLTPIFAVSVDDTILNLTVNRNTQKDEYSADIRLTSLNAKDHGSTTALTIALLSENKDELTTTIPLQNDKQPSFTQITNYFRRLIVKCSVSPYLLLDWPYETLGDRNSISFTPGKTELSLDSRDTLLDYSTLLEKHPLLQLTLQATVQRSADSRVLQEILTAAERKQVELENEKLLQQWQQQKIDSAASTPKDNISVEDISEKDLEEFKPLMPKPIIVTDAMLKKLGVDRAEQIRRYILDQSSISPDNVNASGDVSIIDTLDMPEVRVRLGHIGQK